MIMTPTKDQQAQDFSAARERFNEGMAGTVADWELVNVGETPIIDVFKYVAKKTTTETNNN